MVHVVVAVNEVIRYVINPISHIVTLVYTISAIVDMVDTIVIRLVLISIDGGILGSASPHGVVHLIDMERQRPVLVIFCWLSWRYRGVDDVLKCLTILRGIVFTTGRTSSRMEYQYYVHKTDILYLPIQMQCAAIQMQYDAMRLFETDLYRNDRKGLKFVRGWL